MAVITLTQYKVLLGITDVDVTRDARISALIPQIEQDIIDYCNNHFRINAVVFNGDITPTVAVGPAYSLVGTGFNAIPFAVGDTIELYGTLRNDGRYTITVLTDTVITVTEAIVAEPAIDCDLYLVQFPIPLELYAARMIAYQLAHMADAGLNSETIKTYKYTRSDKNDFSYPKEIITGLDKWANVSTGRRSRRTHYNDERGTWLPLDVDP